MTGLLLEHAALSIEIKWTLPPPSRTYRVSNDRVLRDQYINNCRNQNTFNSKDLERTDKMVLFGPVVVNLLAVKVNTIDRSGTLSFGPTQQIDYFLANKQNQGFGEENGDITFNNVPLSIVIDQDVNDSNSAKTSVI